MLDEIVQRGDITKFVIFLFVKQNPQKLFIYVLYQDFFLFFTILDLIQPTVLGGRRSNEFPPLMVFLARGNFTKKSRAKHCRFFFYILHGTMRSLLLCQRSVMFWKMKSFEYFNVKKLQMRQRLLYWWRRCDQKILIMAHLFIHNTYLHQDFI